MHPEAYQWVAQHAPQHPVRVVEFGSRDINGGVRHLFAGSYLGIDIEAGPGVDVVADAARLDLGGGYDVVVCCEVLEHTPAWREIVASAGRALRAGGVLILTCAGPGRAPHGAEGGPVGGEYYANVTVVELEAETARWGDGIVRTQGADTQAYIVRRAC